MKNQEYLIAALRGEIDDGGSSWEAVVNYNIACPYNVGDKRALCESRKRKMCRETCVKCKAQWLGAEVDND